MYHQTPGPAHGANPANTHRAPDQHPAAGLALRFLPGRLTSCRDDFQLQSAELDILLSFVRLFQVVPPCEWSSVLSVLLACSPGSLSGGSPLKSLCFRFWPEFLRFDCNFTFCSFGLDAGLHQRGVTPFSQVIGGTPPYLTALISKRSLAFPASALARLGLFEQMQLDLTQDQRHSNTKHSQSTATCWTEAITTLQRPFYKFSDF